MTARLQQFKAAIASFIDARREAKRNGEGNDPGGAARYEYRNWLADAARRVGQIQAVTHVLKATHPDAKGSSLHVVPATLPARAEIGSHVLGDGFTEDVVGNAAALDVFKFLKVEVEGRRLLDWMQAGDADLKAALSDDPDEASAWMTAFASLVWQDTAPASHPMAKQVYWLVGDDPQDDANYHLLQPMFSSSLAHAVHADIQDSRFGEDNMAARKAFRERVPHDAPYREYRDLAIRRLGGTKPQNISQLNSERRGLNYLLASLPPPAWKSGGTHLLKQDSAFDGLLWFGNMSGLVRTLAEFLGDEPPPTMETRRRREAIERAIGQELAMYGATIRGQYEAGWTRNHECQLPRCEQLWLDPDRSMLPLRADPQEQADDLEFNDAYQFGEWADEVAGRFGDWLNARLHRFGLLEVSLPERRHWAAQAILEVAWPIPLQRRAAAGGVA
jgi:CRISPR type I-F/YPEST-associated protein Csy1